jgi:endogenous inhibitor of DNA gyrase (YacG/DUF329 family)
MHLNPTTRTPNTVTVACATCGATVYLYPSGVRERNYCSRHCVAVGQARPLAERFWEKVNMSGECWLWLAGCNASGYGWFRTSGLQGRAVLAHRVAWELTNGPIPDGVELCHNCPGGDNPLCVRPDHLWLGTHQENMADSARKGRHWKGREA